jgi:hypothetical protein
VDLAQAEDGGGDAGQEQRSRQASHGVVIDRTEGGVEMSGKSTAAAGWFPTANPCGE